MRPPCESIVKEVLPTVRAILVKELTDKYELSQAKIAEKLAITQPAVSQYLTSARGAEELKKNLRKAGLYSDLEDFAEEIADGSIKRSDMVKRCCEICISMRTEEILCPVHSKNAPSLSEEECRICIETRDKKS